MGSIPRVLGVNRPVTLEGDWGLLMIGWSDVQLFISLDQEPRTVLHDSPLQTVGQKPPHPLNNRVTAFMAFIQAS